MAVLPMKQALIELRDVWKTYVIGENKVHAVRGISFVVDKGDFIAIMGPSGSGKSTTMNLVGSLDVPTKGTILLAGQDIAMLDESSLAQFRGQKIGFVFQQFNLINNLTALENIMLPMAFQGIPFDRREQRARELLESVGLGDRMHHAPSELSGGQQQRVAIARALANDPDVILADEPTGNLDTSTGESVMDLLSKLHKKGKTIIMVTHDEETAGHAKRMIHLRDGKIVKGGRP